MSVVAPSLVSQVPRWRGVLGPNAHRVFGYLRPEATMLAGLTALALLYVPCSLVEPYILFYLVDRIVLAGRPELLVPFVVGILPFLIFATSVEFLLTYMLLRLARSLHLRIKGHQLDTLLEKPVSFFRGMATGKLLFCFFNDSNQIGAVLSVGFVNAVIQLVIVVARTSILAWIDLPLTALWVTAVVPLQLLISYKVMKTAMRLEIELKQRDEDLTARIESLLRGTLVVKSMGFALPLGRIWKRRFADRLDLDFRNMVWKQLGGLVLANLHVAATFAVLFVAVHQIAEGTLSLGTVLAFLAVAGRVIPSLQSLAGFALGIQETLVNLERYYRVHDLPDEAAEFGVTHARATRPCAVDLSHVEIADPIVHHGAQARVRVACRARLRAGGSYLWTGPNGAGKTSVALALAGLVPHAPGTILCGGRPLADVPPATIRSRVLYLGAEPFWPERTLAANFANAGDVDSAALDSERLRDALETAAAIDVVASLLGGMDTVLGEEAHVLSRGENQRLFLAMALYRRPTLLILDEALSHVATADVRTIVERLRASAAVSTVLHVSHRPELYATCDEHVAFAALG